jgi:hypothetical protein
MNESFHPGDRVLYQDELCTVKDVRLDGELIVIEDEYGLAINVIPRMIERLGYKATVDKDGYVESFEDSHA